MIGRQISQKISKYISKTSRAIIIIGQRRVGKTFLLKNLMQKGDLYYDFEEFVDHSLFQRNVAQLQNIFGEKPKKVIFDEIQYLDDAGSIIKLIHDHLPHIKLLASGSASFLLMQNIGDSAMGRKVVFTMYPLTLREMIGASLEDYKGIGGFDTLLSKATLDANTQQVLVYGSLPEVFNESDLAIKKAILKEYISSLLYKDIFSIEGIRNSSKIVKLTQLLALQVGNLVNPNELARQLEVSRDTVVRYIDLLEKFSIINEVASYSKNPRKEISKQSKVYFTDLGVLNALVGDFRPIAMRNTNSLGGLFENLVYNTLKANFEYFDTGHTIHFWRDRNGYEVDFVLTNSQTGKLTPIEVKYGAGVNLTKAFIAHYQNEIDEYHCITRENFWQYI